MKSESILIVDYEHELKSVFKYYPADLIEAWLSSIDIDEIKANNEELTIAQLFIQELKIALGRCLAANKEQDSYPTPISSSSLNFSNTQAIAKLLKDVIPIGYIFCTNPREDHCSITIVLDQYIYQPIAESKRLIEFILLGYRNISCKLFAYGTIVDLINRGDFYYTNLCVMRNCIYHRSSCFEFIEKKSNLISAGKIHVMTNFEKQIKKVDEFIFAAKHFLTNELFGMAAFMLQQALEFTLNAILRAFSGKSTKTHDLVILHKQATYYLPQIIGLVHSKPKRELAILVELQESYVKARYDSDYVITGKQLESFLNSAEQFIDGINIVFNNFMERGF